MRRLETYCLLTSPTAGVCKIVSCTVLSSVFIPKMQALVVVLLIQLMLILFCFSLFTDESAKNGNQAGSIAIGIYVY